MSDDSGLRAVSAASLRADMKKEQVEFLTNWLIERADDVVFVCAAKKTDGKKDRVLVVTRFRILLLGWKSLRKPSMREHKLLDLRAISSAGREADFKFDDDSTLQLKSSKLEQAVRAALHAHELITLCLELPQPRLQLPPSWKTSGLAAEGGTFPDMGFSYAWLACCSYQSASLTAPPAITKQRRQRVAKFLKQLIARPPRRDRVLDLTFCSELNAADFSAVAHVSAAHDPRSYRTRSQPRPSPIPTLRKPQSPTRPGRLATRPPTRLAPSTHVCQVLKNTTMFLGVIVHDVPLNESIASLTECAKTVRASAGVEPAVRVNWSRTGVEPASRVSWNRTGVARQLESNR